MRETERANLALSLAKAYPLRTQTTRGAHTYQVQNLTNRAKEMEKKVRLAFSLRGSPSSREQKELVPLPQDDVRGLLQLQLRVLLPLTGYYHTE